MPDNPEVLDLRRRARRRLMGAIALVLALVVVPPWIMDLEPRPVTTDLTVQIPAQDAKRPPPVAAARPAEVASPAAKADAAKADAVKPEAAMPEGARPGADRSEAAKSATAKPAAAKPEAAKPAAPKPAAQAEQVAKAEAQRAEALLNVESFVVPLGSFASKENVRSLEGKLAKAGIVHYTETITAGGTEQTRVRAGPYPSRDAAEKAREQLKTLGLAPGNVVARQ